MQIRARLIIRKFPALPRSCRVDTAALIQLSFEQENTGTITAHLKGVAPFNKTPTRLTITYLKMAGKAVYIHSPVLYTPPAADGHTSVSQVF